MTTASPEPASFAAGALPQVGIIMGSQSDWATMKHAADVLTALCNAPAAKEAGSGEAVVT